MKIRINKQLDGKTSAEITPKNFPRLFDGAQRIRNISIIELENTIDIQTIYHPDEIKKAITEYLRTLYR